MVWGYVLFSRERGNANFFRPFPGRGSINIYFKQAGHFVRIEGDVLETGGDQYRFALFHEHGVTFSGSDGKTSLEAHVNDKGVQPKIIPVQIPVKHEKIRGKVGTLDQLHGDIVGRGVIHPVTGMVAVVDDIGCQIRV